MIDLTQTENENSKKPFIPRNTEVGLLITGMRLMLSKKDSTPMLELIVEIMSPEFIKIGDKTYPITGISFRKYIMITEDNIETLRMLHTVLKLPLAIDPDAQPGNKGYIDPSGYIGKGIRGAISSKDDTEKNESTGEPLKDDNGQPVKTRNYNLDRILGARSDLDRHLVY